MSRAFRQIRAASQSSLEIRSALLLFITAPEGHLTALPPSLEVNIPLRLENLLLVTQTRW